MSESTFKITCGGCKRVYAWKQERAGKRAKCKCGQIIAMPLRPPNAPEPEESDDLLGLSELAADAQRAVVKPSQIAALSLATPAPAPASQQARIDHRRSKLSQEFNTRSSGPNLIDPIRDLYAPLGLLIAGSLGSLISASLETKLGPTGLAIASAVVVVLTLFKVAVLIGAAFMLAPVLNISFGLFGPAVLKFAAIVIFIDAAELWVDEILRATGGISPSGKTTFYIFFVWIGLAITLMFGLCCYLFSLELSEAAILAIPLAFLSWLIGLIVTVVLFAVMAAMAIAVVAVNPPTIPMAISAPTASAIPIGAGRAIAIPPPVTAAAPPAAAPATSAPSSTDPMTAVDHTVFWRIHPPDGRAQVIGANKWIQMTGRNGAGSPANQLIANMYGAGAVNVYIDLFGGMGKPPIPGPLGPKMYVELPTDNAKIAACVAAAQTYRTKFGNSPTSPADAVTKMFLVVDLER